MKAFMPVAAVARAMIHVAVLLFFSAAIVLARTASTTPGSQPTVDGLRATGSNSLEAALAAGGSGISFDVVQRNTLVAKPDGPRIEVQSPVDQDAVVAVVDELQLNSIFSRGGITADAFWMEIRGTADPKADFAASEFFARVLEQDGKLWRDDGVGWYVTDESPGVGMDPATARLLPGLLGSLTDAAATESKEIDGRLLPGIRGTSKPADYPGVIAADGAAFTESSFEVDCWFDDQGRLVRLEAHAKNLNQTTYDLVSETVVTFTYGGQGDPPKPTPTTAPEVLPTSEPGSVQVKS